LQAIFDGESGNIHVNQENPKYGDQVFREQKMDVALYLEDNQVVFIKDVHIKAEAQTQLIITS